MPEIECGRCGEIFDTDRDEVVPGQSMERCPACGAKNDLPESDGGEVVEVSTDEGTLRLDIHVHVHQ